MLPFERDGVGPDARVVEISYTSLRFSGEETRRYLGGDIADDDVATIQSLTEGWPVALGICRQLLSRHGPVRHQTASLPELLSCSEELRAYFDDGVLRAVPPSLRDFAARMAVPDEINADLAESITEGGGGAALLDLLCRQNLFLFPITSRTPWLRFHPLFAAHLRAHQAPSPAVTADLHRKIAGWLVPRGLYRQAMPHISQVDNAEFVAQLLISSGGWYLHFRGGEVMARVLDSLPLAVLNSHASLVLARIYRLLQTSDVTLARQCFEELKQRTNDFEAVSDPTQPTEADGFIMKLLLSLYEDRILSPQALIKAEADLSADPGDDAIRSSVIRELVSWSFYHAGAFHKALTFGRESVQLSVRAGIPYIEIYASLGIGVAELAVGHVDRAAEIHAQAEAEAARRFGAECNQVMAAQILGAEILYARNQVGTSYRHTARWYEAVTNGDGWVDLYASLYRTLSSSLRALGDGPAAIAVIERARHMARNRRLWRLDQILQNHQLREACLLGDMEQADRLARNLRNEHPRSVAVQNQGWRVWYSRLLALARHALETRDLAGTAELLRSIDRLVLEGTGDHSLCRLERDLLEARLLFERDGDSDAYARPLSRAVVQAASAGLIRPFLDEGSVMLRMLRQYTDTFSLARPIGVFLSEVFAQVAQSHAVQPTERAPEGRAAGNALATSEILSNREAAVLGLIYDGLTSKEIARRLDISVNTVLTHRKSLYRKLRVTTRSQLITIAREQQMLKLTAGAAPYAQAV
jgi:ATP/maltotriose-dependent transcriptional regulator MalT